MRLDPSPTRVWPAMTHAGQLPFADRRDAGRALAERLASLATTHPIVLGIPRGGVPVAAEIARALHADLDVLVARKLGAPSSEELAIGATTADGGRWLNGALIRQLGVSATYLERITAEQMREATRREHLFREGRPPLALAGRTVILVDDGLATGATMRAAARSVRGHAPAKLVVAVPVGARETCEDLRAEADEVICLAMPEPFYAVGMHYRDFGQTSDAEVVELLRGAGVAT